MTVPNRSHPDHRREQGDDRVVLCGLGIGIAFVRFADRWSHSLSVPDGGGIEVARVVEIEPDCDDPTRVVSPVYQELQNHELPGVPGLCLLMTGLWFDHHFSAAVSLAADREQPETVIIEFDVADRCRSPIESLAATYVLRLDSGALAEASPDRVAWNLEGPTPGRLELVADASCLLALAEAGRRATRLQVLSRIQSGHATHRLRYRWRWTSSVARTR